MARKKYVPTEAEISMMEKEFLAGHSIADARLFVNYDIPARCYAEVRESLFDRIRHDTKQIKGLAAGPILNACEIIRYPEKRVKSAPSAEQTSILDICDGRMNVASNS